MNSSDEENYDDMFLVIAEISGAHAVIIADTAYFISDRVVIFFFYNSFRIKEIDRFDTEFAYRFRFSHSDDEECDESGIEDSADNYQPEYTGCLRQDDIIDEIEENSTKNEES